MANKLYNDEQYPSPWGATWREFKQSHIALTGFIILNVFILLGILGPLMTPYEPYAQNFQSILLSPSWENNGTIAHVLGTDAVGRDMLSRILYGIQVTFGASVLLVLGAMVIGVTLGTLAGMNKGVRSSVLNHILDVLMAIPTLLIAIIIVAILGVGLSNAMLAIGLALIPRFVHATRDVVRTEMNKNYIATARLDGASHWHIFYFNILPNLIEHIIVQATLALSIAILDISALGFLNLGAQTLLPELGVMVREGLSTAYIAPWNVLFPGMCIFLLVLSVNIVGDSLRSAIRNRLTH